MSLWFFLGLENIIFTCVKIILYFQGTSFCLTRIYFVLFIETLFHPLPLSRGVINAIFILLKLCLLDLLLIRVVTRPETIFKYTVLELSVTRGRGFDLNVIRELYRFA